MVLQDTEIKKLTGTFNDFITEKTCSALSTLLNEPIEHKLSVFENSIDSKKICLPPNEIKMCSVRLNGKGDVHIELLYTTKLHHAVKIASKLLGTEVSKIDEMGTSALQEVANILTGSFFNALSENTGFRVDLSTPSFKEGELQDLLLEPTCEVMKPTKEGAIITDVLLFGKNTGTEIHMLIIQHPEHARKLLSPKTMDSKTNDYEDSSNTNLLGGESSAIDDLLADFDSKVSIEGTSEIDSLINQATEDLK